MILLSYLQLVITSLALPYFGVVRGRSLFDFCEVAIVILGFEDEDGEGRGASDGVELEGFVQYIRGLYGPYHGCPGFTDAVMILRVRPEMENES